MSGLSSGWSRLEYFTCSNNLGNVFHKLSRIQADKRWFFFHLRFYIFLLLYEATKVCFKRNFFNRKKPYPSLYAIIATIITSPATTKIALTFVTQKTGISWTTNTFSWILHTTSMNTWTRRTQTILFFSQGTSYWAICSWKQLDLNLLYLWNFTGIYWFSNLCYQN